MRVLLAMLLFTTLAIAEAEFGPVGLYRFDSVANPRMRLVAPDQIECVFGPLGALFFSGRGLRVNLQGEPIGDTLRLYNERPEAYLCHPDIKIAATASGGEARVISHFHTHHIEAQFYSADGTLLREPLIETGSPALIFRVDERICIAYTAQNSVPCVPVLWLSDSGQVLRRDTLSIPQVSYGFARNGRAVLVETMPTGSPFGFYLHSVDPEGYHYPADTVSFGAVPEASWTMTPSYDSRDGSLRCVYPLVESHQQTGGMYRILTRYARVEPDTAMISAPQILDSLENIDHLPVFSCLRLLPDGGNVYCYSQPRSPSSTIKHRYLSSEGIAAEPRQLFVVENGYYLTGIDVLVQDGSIYDLYAVESSLGAEQWGCFLRAFPTRYLTTPSAVPVIVAPNRDLGVYPNPFNGAARIEMELSQAGPFDLQVFDIQGRAVQALATGNREAGWHSIQWDADALPSGSYFIRASTRNGVQWKKALLLR